MREDIVGIISNPDTRVQEASEFFGWPVSLVREMFKNSKEYFEGPWRRYFPNKVPLYYQVGYYTIRQLSYSKDDIFGSNVRGFLEQINGPCLDFACGVGDYALYLAMCGHRVGVREHPGIPEVFLEYRIQKYQLEDMIQIDSRLTGKYDYCLLISAIDHIPNPCRFLERSIMPIVSKKIFATPCIDETYDRPTHEKHILKDVPAAFEMIKEFNDDRRA